MGKSIRSKKMKMWRALRREKLSDFERKRLEGFNGKLRDIIDSGTMQTDVQVKQESEDAVEATLATLVAPMNADRPTRARVVVNVEEDQPAPRVTRSRGRVTSVKAK
jgi:hypothetical protein